jgi:hypothetical protein
VPAGIGNRFGRIGAPESQTFAAKRLGPARNLGAVQSFGSRILDQIDVFAVFKPEMLTLQQLKPAKGRYVYLKDESGERCVSLAFSSCWRSHQIGRF